MATQKTVLITGSARGLGLTFAKHYVRNGWKVIAAARNPDAADELRAVGVSKIVALDVADENTVLDAAKMLEGEAIDLLLNNAGVLKYATLKSTDKADMMWQYEVNTVGPFLVTRAFTPQLELAASRRGFALVANMSSQLGSISEINRGDHYGYRASKSALNMVTAALAQDLKPAGIAVVAMHPGVVATDMTNGSGPVQPADSVIGLTTAMDGVALADSGTFFAFDGRKLPW